MLATTIFKAQTYEPYRRVLFSSVLITGQIRFSRIFLPDAANLTGIAQGLITQGVFTAANNNKLGLYAVSGTNLVRVAQTTNDANIWKQAANAAALVPFTSAYSAAAGVYYVAQLYNNGGETTAPKIPNSSGAAILGLAVLNLVKSGSEAPMLTLNGQTDLPASTALSGLTVDSSHSYAALY